MADFTLHNVAIRALHLLDPRIETSNFRQKLLTLLTALAKKEYDAAPEEHDDEWTLADSIASVHCISALKEDFRDVPDAFVIDEEREEIFIFEVEDFHPMPADKAWRIIDLADSISWEFDWTVRVFVSDRYANLTELDIELLQASMIHELGEVQERKTTRMPKRKQFAWADRCMTIRYTCRKCGKFYKDRDRELYDHRYDCNGDAEDRTPLVNPQEESRSNQVEE